MGVLILFWYISILYYNMCTHHTTLRQRRPCIFSTQIDRPCMSNMELWALQWQNVKPAHINYLPVFLFVSHVFVALSMFTSWWEFLYIILAQKLQLMILAFLLDENALNVAAQSCFTIFSPIYLTSFWSQMLPFIGKHDVHRNKHNYIITD